jgi:hypothetical protein
MTYISGTLTHEIFRRHIYSTGQPERQGVRASGI